MDERYDLDPNIGVLCVFLSAETRDSFAFPKFAASWDCINRLH